MPIIFLTVCSHKKQPVLASPEMHNALIKAWNEADHWIVGRYVILPDHIHLFCAPTRRDNAGVADWVSYWKRLVSKEFPELQPIWQRDCWDTQLRRHESYSEKWAYARNNPMRAGLTETPEEWPLQGTLNHLPW